MPLPGAYWASYERNIASTADFFDAVRTISAYQQRTNSRFVWRGVVGADWGLHPSLVRNYQARHGGQVPKENQLRSYERKILEEAVGWGLDWHLASGRLTALELLAALQHYEVPTRLLDFTFNPAIALWFAVEKEDHLDGRVFAIDVAQQAVSRTAAAKADPWWFDESPRVDEPWSTRPWTWTPPPLEPRMVRQNACFVMGGVPSTQPARNLKIPANRLLRADEVRTCMSVPLIVIDYAQAATWLAGGTPPGRPPKASAFTLRISANKADVRADLDRMFGYRYQSLFPDFTGFAKWGEAFR